jgi:hypothetical protein
MMSSREVGKSLCGFSGISSGIDEVVTSGRGVQMAKVGPS